MTFNLAEVSNWMTLFIITEQAVQLVCSGTKRKEKYNYKDKFGYVITKLGYIQCMQSS